MRQLRFVPTEIGLVLETPVPLNPIQRHAAQVFAVNEYKRRLKGMPLGDRRDSVVKVIEKIQKGDFIERAVPAFDSSKESVLYG